MQNLNFDTISVEKNVKLKKKKLPILYLMSGLKKSIASDNLR